MIKILNLVLQFYFLTSVSGGALILLCFKIPGFHLFFSVCLLQSVLSVGMVIHVLNNEGACGYLTFAIAANLTEQTLFQKEMNT